LTAPAVGLLVTSILAVLWGVFGVVVNLLPDTAPAQRQARGKVRRFGEDRPIQPAAPEVAEPKDPLRFPFPVMWYVQGVVGLVIIAGAIQMMRRKMYPLALLAAILGSVPMLGACCVLSVPFGIWGLVVLLKGEVRAAFG
jgi:hypothetical protein